jgi:hypothetical protein
MKELFQLQASMDEDMAGYRGDFAAAYEQGAEKLNIRESVLKSEFRRALTVKRQLEKEKAYDPIERDQRETLRASTAHLVINGQMAFDWFQGGMAAPDETGDTADMDHDPDFDEVEEIPAATAEPEPPAPAKKAGGRKPKVAPPPAAAGEINHTGKHELAVS